MLRGLGELSRRVFREPHLPLLLPEVGFTALPRLGRTVVAVR